MTSLCKLCHKHIRTTLYYCEICRIRHNRDTRKLKQKYREQNLCVCCGKASYGKRCCVECYKKEKLSRKNSEYLQSKKSKKGVFSDIKQILEVI